MKYFGFLCSMLLVGGGSNDRAIKVKGRDTEVNLAVKLAEHFDFEDDSVRVAISGGGSGLGIASLLNGQADIANSSRPLNKDEEAMFKNRGIQLRTVVFAEDATAFIVRWDFPLDSLDVPTLAGILSGETPSWEPITG